MINGIKARVQLVPELSGAVEVAHEVEPVVSESLEPSNCPSVLLFYGPNRYQQNENPARTRQDVDQSVVVLLFALTAEVHSLERAIVQACIGYKYDANWDMPLVASESVTTKIDGEYSVRRIIFTLQGRVTQSPL